jgi:HEAT repeat protein
MGSHDARTLVRQVLDFAEEELPPELGSRVLALGSQAVAPLLELMREGEELVPLHAVELLARLKAPEALLPLLEKLRYTQPGEMLHDALLFGLEEWGPEVAPLALQVIERTQTAEERLGLLAVLARSGSRDERILLVLLAQLQEAPVQAALNLSTLGDPRAIGPLKRAIEAYPLDEDEEDLFANQAIVEMSLAIEDLGGSIDDAQREKTERARNALLRLGMMFRTMLDELHTRPTPRAAPPARDEPCWCGSGLKYKRCHLGRDSR